MLENFPVAQTKKEKPKKTFKERILQNKAAKIAAIFLIMLGSAKSLEASGNTEGGPDPENVKHKIEDARGFLKQIIPDTKNSDNAASHTLNGRNISTCKYPTGQEVTVADNNDYIIVSTDEGRKVFYDDDADGSLDRVVLNKGEEEERIFVKNAMYAFQSMEEMAEQAEVIADLMPKQVSVLNLNHENGEAQFVDMSDGASGTFTEDDADGLINTMQDRYTQELEEISQDLNK